MRHFNRFNVQPPPHLGALLPQRVELEQAYKTFGPMKILFCPAGGFSRYLYEVTDAQLSPEALIDDLLSPAIFKHL